MNEKLLLLFLPKAWYSEKAAKFCEISTLLLSVFTVEKSKVEFLQNFVTFSKHTNFTVCRGGEPQYIVPQQNVFLELRQKIQHKAGFLVRSTKVSQMKVK